MSQCKKTRLNIHPHTVPVLDVGEWVGGWGWRGGRGVCVCVCVRVRVCVENAVLFEATQL